MGPLVMIPDCPTSLNIVVYWDGIESYDFTVISDGTICQFVLSGTH